jgi:type IV secretory pathway TraG/TraD family ATPase VirD4
VQERGSRSGRQRWNWAVWRNRRPSRESTAYRRLLPPEALRQLKPRRALLVYGHLPPVRVRLRPWFRSRRLASLAMAVDAAVPHPAMQVDDLAPVQPLHRADGDGEVAA